MKLPFQIGTDIVSVSRMKFAIERQGKRFLDRVFTPEEQAYCGSKRYPFEHYAARFAAKEAMMKAMEIRRQNRLRFREIEVRRRPTGKPVICLSGASRKRFGVPAAAQIELSMSHERKYAVSFVVMILPEK